METCEKKSGKKYGEQWGAGFWAHWQLCVYTACVCVCWSGQTKQSANPADSLNRE